MINATWIDTFRLIRRRRAGRGLPGPPGTRLHRAPEANLRVRVAEGAGKPTIVFIADPPNTVEHYDALFELLTPRINVVCLEAPGFGFSFPKRGFRFTLEENASLLLNLLRDLDLGPYVLAPSCVAAYPALRVAAGESSLVRGLILIQAPSWPEEQRWAQRVDANGLVRTPVIGQALLALSPVRVARGWYRGALPRGSEIDDFLGPCSKAFSRGACFCLASGFQANFHRQLEFKVPPQPALAVWGTSDWTHEETDKRSTLQLVPDAGWAEFEASGHFPELENPERFSELALEFVASYVHG